MNHPLHLLRRAYSALLTVPRELQLMRLIQEQPVLVAREELPLLLNVLGLRGEGAEIGVQRATFSTVLLSQWGGACLHSIDPWRNFDDHSYVDRANRTDEAHEDIFRVASQRLAEFGGRSSIHRKTSAEAATEFADGSLDFAYIDAQHHYEAVLEDLTLWAPKVRPGGILAGHDYLDGEIDDTRYGVKRAVDEFMRERGWKFGITLEKEFPTWFTRIPFTP